MDYENSRLNKVKEFNYFHFSFTSILNNSKLVLICEKHVLIIDNDFVIIK